MKYYKNTNGNLFVDPILSKHNDLTEITKEEFNLLLEPTSEELLKQAKSNLVNMTDAHIQAEIIKYNEANNVMFGSIHNCSTYVTVNSYPHQAFCISIIQWNADVWETVRAIATLPTDEEFQAILDSVVFNG